MSSGGAPDRDGRETRRVQQLHEALEALRPIGNDWVREVSERDQPPTQTEWLLWRRLNRVLGLLR